MFENGVFKKKKPALGVGMSCVHSSTSLENSKTCSKPTGCRWLPCRFPGKPRTWISRHIHVCVSSPNDECPAVLSAATNTSGGSSWRHKSAPRLPRNCLGLLGPAGASPLPNSSVWILCRDGVGALLPKGDTSLSQHRAGSWKMRCLNQHAP